MTVIDKFDRFSSLDPMSEQASVVGEIIADVMKRSPDGVHLLCYSQGAILPCTQYLAKYRSVTLHVHE